MATEPISDLPITNVLTGSESVVLNQSGVTKTAPSSAFASLSPHSLETDTDVFLTMPASGQILVFNGVQWVNTAPSITAPFIPINDFIFTQSVPASSWYIVHNLNRFPSVTITDSTQEIVIGDITYNQFDNNSLTITFSGLISGSAYLV